MTDDWPKAGAAGFAPIEGVPKDGAPKDGAPNFGPLAAGALPKELEPKAGAGLEVPAPVPNGVEPKGDAAALAPKAPV